MQRKQSATYNGFTVEVGYDDNVESPRDWQDPIGKMVCWHDVYILGDEHEFKTPKDFEETKRSAYVILPLYLFEEGFLEIATESFIESNDIDFDETDDDGFKKYERASDFLGYIYVSQEDALDAGCKITRENKKSVEEILEDEIEEYNNFLYCDSYAFVITNSDGEQIISGNNYYANSIEEAISQMKRCCWEYDFLFEELQKQMENEQITFQ